MDAQRWVLVAVILGSGMTIIDGTAVNTALPTMQAGLHGDLATMQWVVEGYLLSLSALLLLGGALGDHLGRRKVFLAGTLLFAATSAACAFAPNALVLAIARVFQGLAGALLMPSSLAILTATFPEAERGKAIGTWSGWTAIASAIGQVAGGLLAQYASWRWIFLLNLPLAAGVVWLSLRHMADSHGEDRPLDWPGALLAVGGLGALTYGMLESSRGGPWWLALVGLAVLGGFLAWERRATSPLVPLGIFKSATFSGVNGLTLLLYGALGGMMFLLPFDLVQVQGYGQTTAGFAMLPVVVIMWAFSGRAGALADRSGPRLPLVLGPALAGLGFAAMAVPGVGGSYWLTFFPGMVLLAVGMTITVAPLTTAAMNAVPAEQAGLASGVNNAVARLAGLLAIALFGWVVLVVFRWQLAAHGAPPALLAHATELMAAPGPRELLVPAFVWGFRAAMGLAALLALLGAGVAALVLPRQRV